MTTAISFEAGDIAAAPSGNAPARAGQSAGSSFAEALERKQTEAVPPDSVRSERQMINEQAFPAKGGDPGAGSAIAEQKGAQPPAERQSGKREKTKDKAEAAEGCPLNGQISVPLAATVLPPAGPSFGGPPVQGAAKRAEEDKGCGQAGSVPAGALADPAAITAKAPANKEKQDASALTVAPPVAQAQDAATLTVAPPVAQAQDAAALTVAPPVAQAQDMGFNGADLMKTMLPSPVPAEAQTIATPISPQGSISKQPMTGTVRAEAAPVGTQQPVDKSSSGTPTHAKEHGKDDPSAAAAPISGGPADAKPAGGHIQAEALHPANIVASSSAAHEIATADTMSHATTMSAGDEKMLNAQPGVAAQMQAQVRSTQASHVSGMVEAARLVQRVNQSELNLNLQTSEFGRVDIRTTLSKHAFAASIYVEQDALLPILAAELPSLHMHLSEHGVEANVTLNPSSFSQNSSAQAGAGQQDRRQTRPQPPSLDPPREVTRSGAALSRTKSLTSLLDVHA